jgi:hypothetical protein
MDRRSRPRSRAACRRFASPIAVLLLLVAAAVSVPAEASPHPTGSYWTRCLPSARVAGLELSPVEVRHLSCAQADQAIRREGPAYPRRPDLLDARIHMPLDEHPAAD